MIFAKIFARNYEKRYILGTSDAWSMSLLSQRPSTPAYYIKDCRIYGAGFEVQTGSLLRIVQTILESLIFLLNHAEKFSIERNMTSHFFCQRISCFTYRIFRITFA